MIFVNLVQFFINFKKICSTTCTTKLSINFVISKNTNFSNKKKLLCKKFNNNLMVIFNFENHDDDVGILKVISTARHSISVCTFLL